MIRPDEAGLRIRLLSLRLALRAIITPYPSRLAAVLPVSEEPKELTDLLDTMCCVGDIDYNPKVGTYTWIWLDDSYTGVDLDIDKVVEFIVENCVDKLRLHETIHDEDE